MRLSAILLDNILILRFVYGLAFFSLGLMVVVQLRAPSRYRLACRCRWRLGSSG